MRVFEGGGDEGRRGRIREKEGEEEEERGGGAVRCTLVEETSRGDE